MANKSLSKVKAILILSIILAINLGSPAASQKNLDKPSNLLLNAIIFNLEISDFIGICVLGI